jgi:hypothetical protein
VNLKEVVVVACDDFREQVERASADDQVADLRSSLQMACRSLDITGHPNPEHGRPGHPELHRIGDRDNLNDPGFLKALNPLANRGLGQADRATDRGVGPTTVLLELLDDGQRRVIQSGHGSHTNAEIEGKQVNSSSVITTVADSIVVAGK